MLETWPPEGGPHTSSLPLLCPMAEICGNWLNETLGSAEILMSKQLWHLCPMGQLSHCGSNYAIFLFGGCTPSTGSMPLGARLTQHTHAANPIKQL